VLNVVRSLFHVALALFKTRRQLAMEILALRHQLGVLKRSVKRPRLPPDMCGSAAPSTRLEQCADRRQAGYRDQMASGRIPSVLDLAQPAQRRPASHPSQDPGAHQAHGHRLLQCLRRNLCCPIATLRSPWDQPEEPAESKGKQTRRNQTDQMIIIRKRNQTNQNPTRRITDTKHYGRATFRA
jgi:hypothetical protein